MASPIAGIAERSRSRGLGLGQGRASGTAFVVVRAVRWEVQKQRVNPVLHARSNIKCTS